MNSQSIQFFQESHDSKSFIRVYVCARAKAPCLWSYCSFTRLLCDDKYAHDDFSNEYKHTNIESQWIDRTIVHIFIVPLSRWVSHLYDGTKDVNYIFNKRRNRIFCFLFIYVYIQEQMSSDVNVHIDIDTHTCVFTYTGRVKKNDQWQ